MIRAIRGWPRRAGAIGPIADGRKPVVLLERRDGAGGHSDREARQAFVEPRHAREAALASSL
jgi:hypothetical protein